MIRAACPKCNAALQVEDQHAGKLIACPKCKTSLQLPQVQSASPPSPPPKPIAAPAVAAPSPLPPVVPPKPTAADSPALPSASVPPPVSAPAPASGKLLGVVPVQIAPPILGMTAVVLLALLASFFCGSFLVFFFAFLHNVGAVAGIVLTTRLQRFMYALLAALLTMTAWGWLCFTAVWTVVSILGLLVGIAVGVWAMFAFFRPETRRQFADPSLPARLERLPFPALAGILGGGSLTLILGIGMVFWLTTGSKTGGGRGGNDAGKGFVKNGKDSGDVKVDLPDFSKVDYSFDVSKVDYTKGPQGQKVETRTENGPNDVVRSEQQYQRPDGKPVYHGKIVQTMQGVKRSENHLFAGYQHGQQTEWHTNGKMKITGIMKDGKKHGKWQHWYENGKLQKEEFFLNGVPHGPETTWFENGQKQYESSFVEDNMHGRSTAWWENGQKASEIHYKKNVVHGPATWWNENGRVSDERQL